MTPLPAVGTFSFGLPCSALIGGLYLDLLYLILSCLVAVAWRPTLS